VVAERNLIYYVPKQLIHSFLPVSTTTNRNIRLNAQIKCAPKKIKPYADEGTIRLNYCEACDHKKSRNQPLIVIAPLAKLPPVICEILPSGEIVPQTSDLFSN
jgi:hypothetical protein